MDFQKMVDSMNEMNSMTRSGYHLTLGKFIAELEKVPAETPVRFYGGNYPADAHSYRGYYSDLAFEEVDNPQTAGDLLAECRRANGRVFEGYKGGDFRMHGGTPLWSASYGCCGQAIVGARLQDGELILERKQVD